MRVTWRRLITACLALLLGLAGPALRPPPAAAGVRAWQQQASTFDSWTTGGYGTPATCAKIHDLAVTGHTQVSFVVMWEQATATTSVIRRGPQTTSDAALAAGIACAKRNRLRVMLKLHVEAIDPATRRLITWRANIRPADRAAWMASYGAFMQYYGRFGQARGVSDICVGAELTTMTSTRAAFDVDGRNTARWRYRIAQLRTVFTGKLTFSAQRPGSMGEFDTIGFWPQLDYYGLSGYFPLTVTGTPTLTTLRARWAQVERQLRPVLDRTRVNGVYTKKLVFLEIGFRSLAGANEDPWSYDRAGPADQALQALCYEAFYSFWNAVAYMNGVHWWQVDARPDVSATSTSYTYQGKRAAAVVARWHGGTLVESRWPRRNATITGPTTFRAVMLDAPPGSYAATWRVGAGAENPMRDSSVGGAHKAAAVDLSGWTWAGRGPYAVTFTARNHRTGVVARTTVNVYNGAAGAAPAP